MLSLRGPWGPVVAFLIFACALCPAFADNSGLDKIEYFVGDAHRKCTSSFDRCAGEENKTFVKYAECCDKRLECVPDKSRSWGRFCLPVEKSCYKSGERCIGAEGYPVVEFKPCCDASASCEKDPKRGWGSFCVGGEHSQKCYPTGARCAGAPGKPYVDYQECCDSDAYCGEDPALGWGSFCQIPNVKRSGSYPPPNPSGDYAPVSSGDYPSHTPPVEHHGSKHYKTAYPTTTLSKQRHYPGYHGEHSGGHDKYPAPDYYQTAYPTTTMSKQRYYPGYKGGPSGGHAKHPTHPKAKFTTTVPTTTSTTSTTSSTTSTTTSTASTTTSTTSTSTESSTTTTMSIVAPCESTQESGGRGETTISVDMGTTSGTFTVTYTMFTIPDELIITYEGATLFTTGGLVSGSNTVQVSFSGSTSMVQFTLRAPEAGTFWEFTASCPDGTTPEESPVSM